MGEYTPMMRQYLKTKEAFSDCILFYRLGDFYEMFFSDAEIVSRELELTLTGKNCGMEERAPMCGVPHHSLDFHLSRLVEKGYKVAVCEQVEDPKDAKGIVRREVTRIVTPGTNMAKAMQNDENLYITCVVCVDDSYGYATADVSTGEFIVAQLLSFSHLFEEMQKRTPSELIVNAAFFIKHPEYESIVQKNGVTVTRIDDTAIELKAEQTYLKAHFKDIPSVKEIPLGLCAAGELLKYLNHTQMTELSHITHMDVLSDRTVMGIDAFSFRNLELTETMREKEKRGSLFWVLDKTKTAMGSRMLASFVRQPLLDVEKIESRLDAVEELKDDVFLREELREYLSRIYDLERLMTRISYQSAGPRDLLAFRDSLSYLPAIKTLLSDRKAPLLKTLFEELDELSDLYTLIFNRILDDASPGAHDGNIIKEGFSEEVDTLRKAKTNGKQWLSEMEESERQKTGIKTLKIKYNRVFGYCIEVTKSYLDMVPDSYIRRQTLANAERFFTNELKALEDEVLGAQDKLIRLEYDIFKDTLQELSGGIVRIQKSAHAVAMLDALLSLAHVAAKRHYVKPTINTDGLIDIKEARHPVVELMTNDASFVSNDVLLDMEENRLIILTGPNMAGKSTYMRQTALITIMAQMGSYVPAQEANIGIVNRVFTRVGASDDLAAGQSTFMVEMNEMANILKYADAHSLIILDEIGRGTSTYDGLSIAKAVAEYILDPNKIGAKTMFATHYHEMTELADASYGVKNYSIAVKEKGDDIIFLRKIVSGGADKSYGIQVAKLAGVPDEVILRAKEILQQLIFQAPENKFVYEETSAANTYGKQLSFIDPKDEIIDILEETDCSRLTPIDALNLLYKLQEKIKDSCNNE